jgi:hypothetical protein
MTTTTTIPTHKDTFGESLKHDDFISVYNHPAPSKLYLKKDGELYVGAIGGAYTFCFTATGIGEIVTVKAADGDELDLTDYDTW